MFSPFMFQSYHSVLFLLVKSVKGKKKAAAAMNSFSGTDHKVALTVTKKRHIRIVHVITDEIFSFHSS